MIIVQGSASVDPASVGALKTAAAAMMAETRKEQGCLHYSLAIEDEEAGILSISERWADEASLKGHFKAPHMVVFNAVLAGKVRRLDVKLYDASGERAIG